jgi:putative resolvase
MSKEIYVNANKAKELLGVHVTTLRRWELQGKIECMRTVGNHRMYNVNKYLKDNGATMNDDKKEELANKIKTNICYVRVSTNDKKNDLEIQKEYMKNKYPTYEIIEDIGSGINFNRKGLKKIIKMGIEGKINKIVVENKNILSRHGYELIEEIIKEYSEGEIIIENTNKNDKNEKEELAEDMLQIINAYKIK